jgi:hypothetical protein
MAIKDLTDKQRLEAVIAEAGRLADTGEYHDYTDIEYALSFDQALWDARALLNSQQLRLELNRRCADAREMREIVNA